MTIEIGAANGAILAVTASLFRAWIAIAVAIWATIETEAAAIKVHGNR
jgi:hypothetical protein